METYEYGSLSEHRKLHQNLTDQLREQVELATRSAASPSKLKMFLYTWFAGHTTHEDQMCARHIKAVREPAV